MFPFFILLFVPIMIQRIAIKGYYISYEKKNKFALLFFFFFLTILLMLRHETIGNDTANYIYYFEALQEIPWREAGKLSIEPGFVYLTKFITVFTEESQVYLAIVAIIINAMIYPTYKRLCVDTSLTIVLFCIMSTFVMMFSGIRQMLAIGVGFIAYEFTRRKEIIPFVLTVALAMSFHTSAFMLAFMYPVYHAKITKKWLYIVVPAMAAIFVFNESVFSFLIILLERYTRFEGEISSTGAYTMLILFILFAIFSYLIPDESKVDKEIIGLRNLLLLAIVIQMFAPLHTISMRMGYYFIVFIPLLLPKIISCKSNRWKQVAAVANHIMIGFFLLYFFYNAYTASNNLNVFPYSFFWEEV